MQDARALVGAAREELRLARAAPGAGHAAAAGRLAVRGVLRDRGVTARPELGDGELAALAEEIGLILPGGLGDDSLEAAANAVAWAAASLSVT